MSCSYAESLYALFSLGGLFYLFSGAHNLSTVWLALSGLTRSNGMLNAGYICYQTMHQTYNALFAEKHFLVSYLPSPPPIIRITSEILSIDCMTCK